MAETTHIAWCRSTFNHFIGCTKVSPGCGHCYAEAQDSRKRWCGVTHWGAGHKYDLDDPVQVEGAAFELARIMDNSFTLALKDRAGADPAEWPEDLRVREFPA